MKRVGLCRGIIGVLLVAAMLCGCVNTPASGLLNGSDSAPDFAPEATPDVSGLAPVLPEDEELAAMLTRMRGAKAEECSVYWTTKDGGTDKVRITSEFISGIAEVLATEPFERRVYEQGSFYSDVNLDISYRVYDMPDQRSSDNLSIYLLTDNPDNGTNAGKLSVSFSGLTGDYLNYIYENSSYNKLAQVLEAFRSTAPVSFDGFYVPMESKYSETVNNEYPYLSETLQFGDTLLNLWGCYNQPPSGGLELVDAKTGKLLFSTSLNGQALRLEKTTATPYNYQIRYRDKTEYGHSGERRKAYVFTPPEKIKQQIWTDDEIYPELPFDADLQTKRLAYSAQSGIYLCDLDGGAQRQVLFNKDIPAIVKDNELPEYDVSQLRYAAPLLMNGGKQLVASIYLMTNGNYNTTPQGFTVVDLTTGEMYHRTDMVWLSVVNRIDDKTIGYLGSGQTSGYRLLDVTTGDARTADYNFHEAETFDYKTFAQVEEGIDGDGETLHTLYLYSLDNPEKKTTLLTVKCGFLRVWAVTESNILCAYDDGKNNEQRGYLIVPYDSDLV